VRLAGQDVELVSSSSVFSGRGLDKATAVMLDRLDALSEVPTGARLLDLGCGWGPIALTAALIRPEAEVWGVDARARARELTAALIHPDAEVWAVDVSARARELTAQNAHRLGLTNVRVIAPEEVPEDLVLDVIWSNPPIRIGKPALHALLLEWIGRLAPEGTA